jgi:transposase-like protein
MNFHSLGESKCSLLTLPVWDPASLRTRNTVVSPLVRTVIHEYLEAEMAEAVGAEKGERVERRLVAALTEMYVQGVSTRKVKAISEDTVLARAR